MFILSFSCHIYFDYMCWILCYYYISVKGKRYFDCPSKYGGFVKYSQILCGNYPEKNVVEELEM